MAAAERNMNGKIKSTYQQHLMHEWWLETFICIEKTKIHNNSDIIQHFQIDQISQILVCYITSKNYFW